MSDKKPNYNQNVTYGEGKDAITKPRLFVRNEPNGFGYQVIDRLGGPNEARKFKVLFHTPNNAKANDAMACLIENKPLPSTDGDVWPPLIIHLREKHGDWNIAVHTIKELFENCIRIVKRRHKEGWYLAPEKVAPKELGLSEIQIGKIPEGVIKKIAIEALGQYKKELAFYEEYKKIWEEINKAINGDGVAALNVLKQRERYEYEYFQILKPDKEYV